MNKAKKLLAPILSGAVAVWSAYNLVHAARDGRILRAVLEGVLTLVFIVVTWFLVDSAKRFSDS